MKQGILFILLIIVCTSVRSQIDSTKSKSDSIQMGNLIIINQPGEKSSSKASNDEEDSSRHLRHQRRGNFSSKDWVIDIGFANFTDKTDYAFSNSQNYTVSRNGSNPLSANDFKLRQIKSSNFNLWFFMQRMNLVKHFVNLKYGLGLEFNNYRFEKSISFKEGGPNPYNSSMNINHAFAFMDSVSFKKDKLALNYITVPLMLNFQTNPNYSDKGISFSAGISMGYLISSRNKQISSERGKRHNKGDFDNEKFKLSYIGELGLGKVRLYGSYSPKSVFQKGLDLRPYSIGIRFSRW